ncbi:leucine carboxyl methyltransferase 2-like protein [Fennellomyces sp. T-0311]|nr:leucine carboxyl methyltransferase 2-like protein [Fennellomyces sp. T-0311]
MASALHEAPEDEAIRGTNDDATVSRLSAVQLGYFQDPFVQYFVRRPIRRSPIINRGSYIRNHALDSLVRQFLRIDTPKKKQVVSLGAGFDTRYFLMKAGQWGDCSQLARYFEIDFPEIVVKKAMTIKRRPQLSQLVQNARIEKGGAELASDEYFLLSGDLREWSDIVERLSVYGFDTSAPTLVISECVLIYLEAEHSDAILQWMTRELTDCMFVLYEQIKPNDSFGQVMIRNLQSRRIELKGIHAYPELKDQETRFTRLGWDGAKAVDTSTIHDQYLDRSDIARMARLEILDELEEWHLLAAHYCVAWAYKSAAAKDAFSSIQLGRAT